MKQCQLKRARYGKKMVGKEHNGMEWIKQKKMEDLSQVWMSNVLGLNKGVVLLVVKNGQLV